MPSYLNELLARVVALQLEAMALLEVPADAWPHFLQPQDTFPYFVNRVANTPIEDDGSEVIDFNRPLVVMRLVIGHVTTGYIGEPEYRLYEWLPTIKTHFQQRTWLQSTAYPAAMEGLLWARVIDGGGMGMYNDGGVNTTQVGAQIQLSCNFGVSVEQDYY
jgi:hypothetical protein